MNLLKINVDLINEINDKINNIVWGVPMIILILGVGIYFTIRLGAPQITKIKTIFKGTVAKFFQKDKKKKKNKVKDKISSVEAALVSLGEIVGSGNIAGVATAIASGGPGALVWMWIAAFFGMATKYVEIALGLLYRKYNKKEKKYKGGPMYYLKYGMNSKFLAILYAILAVLSYIVIVAMVDTNTIVNAVQTKFPTVPAYAIAITLIVIVGIIIFGGIKRLGNFSKLFVPCMVVLYILTGIVVLIVNHDMVLSSFQIIFTSAFKPQAALGGFAGASVAQIIRYGFARGIYSNEAGLGTAAIAHSASEEENPISQALWAPVEIFVDTIIVNTITGLIVTISGLWTTGADGAELVINAFNTVLPTSIGSYVIFVASIAFSFTCLTSASYICEECTEFIFGKKFKNVIRVLWLIFIYIGATLELELVWNLSDTINGLMLIPNLIGVLFLGNKVVKLSKEYFKKSN